MNVAKEASYETLTGYVPPWEIDANGHWNTQFYLRAFGNAAERAAGRRSGREVLVDHIRFFRELRVLETLNISSVRVPGTTESYGLAQVMRNGTTDALCACAYSNVPSQALAALPLLSPHLHQRTAPRGLARSAHLPQDTEALLRSGRAAVTHLGVLHPTDVGEDGGLTAQAVQGRVSDGAGQMWAFLGVQQSDFYDNGFGRAIVELKISRRGTAEAGQPVRLISWLQDLGERGFYLRHRLESLATGTALADQSSMTLVLNLKERRSSPVPEPIRRKLLQLRVGKTGAAE